MYQCRCNATIMLALALARKLPLLNQLGFKLGLKLRPNHETVWRESCFKTHNKNIYSGACAWGYNYIVSCCRDNCKPSLWGVCPGRGTSTEGGYRFCSKGPTLQMPRAAEALASENSPDHRFMNSPDWCFLPLPPLHHHLSPLTISLLVRLFPPVFELVTKSIL